jgi:hypothetical protein
MEVSQISKESIIDCRGLLPVRQRTSRVLCPSVFSSTGWTHRPLSFKELLRCFDIPPNAIPEKTDTDNDNDHEIWQQHPPIKVLQRVFHHWATESNILFTRYSIVR